MKSYTDLEQSKKLAEILPIESADMHYVTWTILDSEFIVSPNQGSTIEDLQEDYGNQIIPCWSLAALLDILPRFIEFKGDKYYLRFMKEYVEYANDEISITGRCLHTIGDDNLVDACVDMILKLKEENLL